jgi:hypothetical protein
MLCIRLETKNIGLLLVDVRTAKHRKREIDKQIDKYCLNC